MFHLCLSHTLHSLIIYLLLYWSLSLPAVILRDGVNTALSNHFVSTDEILQVWALILLTAIVPVA